MKESSIELVNLKMAFGSFDPVKTTDAEAMHLLQECVRLNYSPPDFLLPYVGKAVEAWGKSNGKKIAFKDIKGEWGHLIWLVHFYFVTGDPNIARDKRKEAAITFVEGLNPMVGGKEIIYDTLERYYDMAEYRYIKDDVEEKHGPRIK